MNHVLKYVVQFELSETTRWLQSAEDDLALLRVCAEEIARTASKGPLPSITVIREERRLHELTKAAA